MKKAIIFAVVACLLSLAATTTYLVKTHKPEPVAIDSLHAKAVATAKDSTRADTARHVADRKDSTAKRDAAHPDSTHSAAKPDSAPAVAQAQPAVAPSATVRPAATQADPAAKAAAYKQVARVLSAMKPVEAAKVLAFLSDEEVEGLLRAVGPRQAADFLTNIPKERAAGLSRRLLVPKGQSR
jgi:flagellar motility protein MotE (MotC chaperone)